MDSSQSKHTILMLHGATYAASATLDFKIDGMSFMDFLAMQGHDVFLVDHGGYGLSSWYPEMDKPAEDAPPLAALEQLSSDVESACEFILNLRKVPKITFVAWSTGSLPAGVYASKYPERVEMILNSGPLWPVSWSESSKSIPMPAVLPAYRVVAAEEARVRCLRGIPESKVEEIHPKNQFDVWMDGLINTDSWGRNQSPKKLRAPFGILADLMRSGNTGVPLLNLSEIKCPVLSVRAEWDGEATEPAVSEYFHKLTNVPYKRFVQINEGTHFLPVEKNRTQLFQIMAYFLEGR